MSERVKADPRASVDALAPRPRCSEPLVTKHFAEAWQEVERPLRAYLASLGANRQQIDDAVQETAARALERSVIYTDGQDLRRWCFVVARRTWIDELRRERRTMPLEAAVGDEDRSGACSLGRVEDRHLLAQVVRTIPGLKESDRSVLVEDAAPTLSAAERNRRNVARHRARNRLRALLGPFSAGGFFGLGWTRRLGRPVTATAIPALAAASLALGVALTVPEDAELRLEVEARPSDVPFGTSSDASAVAGPSGHLPAQASVPSSALPRPAPVSVVPTEVDPEVRVEAPAGTFVSVRRDQQAEGEALLCLYGDLVNACLDVRLHPQPAAPDADTAATATGADASDAFPSGP